MFRTSSPTPADGLEGPAIVAQLHTWLAIASVVIVLLAGAEAGRRVWRRSAPGVAAARIEGVLLLAIGVAAAGGLGLLAGGGHPRETLHFVYAVLALGALPVASGLARKASPRRRGLASLVGAIIALVILARLFGTG